MADKLAGGIKAGSTSVTALFLLRAADTGLEVTGKVATDLTVSYWRQGGTRTAISPSDLAAADSAYSSGGVKEVDATNQPGVYRLDLPNAAVATGADWVVISVKALGCLVWHERFALETTGAAENNALLVAIKAKTDQLVFTLTNKVDASIQAAGDFVQAAADKVWSSATRTLSAFGFTVSLANHPFDDAAAAHNTAGTLGASVNTAAGLLELSAAAHNGAGTIGEKINAAASAGDPWSTAIPGSYTAGQAGYVLGGLNLSAADITAIKAKTDQLTFTTPNVVDASGGVTAAAVATAVWATIVEQQGNISARQALDVLLAVMAGTTENGGLLFKSPNGGATRVVGTKNTQGDRESVTLTPSP